MPSITSNQDGFDSSTNDLCVEPVQRRCRTVLRWLQTFFIALGVLLFSSFISGLDLQWNGVSVHLPLFQAQADVSYMYDEDGRLTGVVDATGNAASYTYDSAGNITSIARQNAGQVAVLEFTPNGGPVGTQVTISGIGFSATPSQNTVKFNGVTAVVTSASTTTLVTSVPSGATTGLINVTTPGGTANSSSAFTVGAGSAPTITGFTPTIGLTGTAITVSGTNFQTTLQNNKTTLNTTTASVTSATATTLGTSVPSGTTSGYIAVSTPYGKAVSAADFYIPPSPWLVSDIQYTGRMNIGGTQTVTISTAGKKGLLLFDGTAGQRVSISLSGVTMAGADLSVLQPNGTYLISQRSIASGIFIDAISLPASGTYTIAINPGTSAGSATITLNSVPLDINGTVTVDGSSVTPTISVAGQNAIYTFSGSAGQRIGIPWSGTISPLVLTLYKPAIGGAASTSSGTIWTSPFNSNSGYSDVLTLSSSGTYTFVVDPVGTATGSVTLSLQTVPPDVTGTITADGPAVTATTTGAGQNASYTFSGTAGQRIALLLSNNTYSLANVSIMTSSGGSIWSSGGTGSFSDVRTLPANDTYTVLVDPLGTVTGSVTLSLQTVPPDVTGTITVGGPAVNVSTTGAGQNAVLTFNGTTGQQVTVRLTNNTMSSVSVTLERSNGSGLANNVSSSSSFNLSTQTLPATETYTIRIDPLGTNTGSITVTLTNP